jgi:fibronectin-binding autotransporter adhesin
VVSVFGGTFQIGNGGANNLNLTGGTVISTVANTVLQIGGVNTNPSTITSTVTLSNDNSRIKGGATFQVATGSTANGVDLDVYAPLTGPETNPPLYFKTGAGVLRLDAAGSNAGLAVNGGKLRVDDFAVLASVPLSFGDGTALQYGGQSTSTSITIPVSAGMVGIEVLQAATTLTLTTPLTGAGGLVIRGAGTLVLPAGSTYAGGTTIDGATFPAANDVSSGIPYGGISVINGGTMLYTSSSSTARTFTLDSGGAVAIAAGQTLTLTGARVNGGFLNGPGTFAASGGTVLSGVTTFASTTLSVTGAASFVNFTNGSAITVTAEVPAAATFVGFTNQGSGSITVGSASTVNASDFQTYGLLTLNPAVVGSGQTTELVNTGTTPLYFNGGSRTFIGTPVTASQFLAGVDLRGQNAIVAGGLFVNNGFVGDSSNNGAGTATIIADFGSLVKGAGFFQNSVITQNGGKFQAGNSPGSASFGNFVMGPGGVSNYVFAIDDATGTAGPSPDANGHVSGWGLVKAVQRSAGPVTTLGDFTWTATQADKLTIAIDTLINPTTVGTDIAGPMADFDPMRTYTWSAVQWFGSYAGPTNVASLDAATIFDTSGIVNPIHGTFGWGLDAADQSLSLTYTPTPVPEPGSLALSGIAAIGWVTFWRRRWQLNAPPSTLSA